jgi:hypothetical protein
MLYAYEWFELIVAHQIRRETSAIELPKLVTSAENR